MQSRSHEDLDNLAEGQGTMDGADHIPGDGNDQAAVFQPQKPLHKDLFGGQTGTKRTKKGKKTKKSNPASYTMSSKTASILKNNFLK